MKTKIWAHFQVGGFGPYPETSSENSDQHTSLFQEQRTSTVNIICGLLATRSCMMACDEQFQPQPTLGTSPTPQLLSPLSLPRVQRLKFQEESRPTQWNVRSPGWKNWHKQYLGQLQAMDNACWVFYTLIDEKAFASPLLFPNSSSQCFKHFGARELAKRRSKNIAMKKHPDSSPSEKNKQTKSPKHYSSQTGETRPCFGCGHNGRQSRDPGQRVRRFGWHLCVSF